MSSYEKENRDGAETEEQRPPHRGGDRGQDQRCLLYTSRCV